jgi:S-methylmethionine-dependent homocysteine/selenocysteine methylase
MDLDIFRNTKNKHRPLILDGSIGSLIQQKGFKSKGKSWMTYVNSDSPETIISIHSGYIDAGADIITTNTFRTNPDAFNGDILRSKKEVRMAVSLAKSTISGKSILIAGSNAPAEDCYQEFRTVSKSLLEINHNNHIDLLVDSSVDFILNETQSHWDEIEIICKHCYSNSIPFVVSLYIQENVSLLSGEPVSDAISLISDHGASAVGINCITPGIFNKFLSTVIVPEVWGFYLNCGLGNHSEKIIESCISPEIYLNSVEESLKYSPAFVGACCGSGFEHIKKIKEFLDGKD